MDHTPYSARVECGIGRRSGIFSPQGLWRSRVDPGRAGGVQWAERPRLSLLARLPIDSLL
jgi:hypothetical protein